MKNYNLLLLSFLFLFFSCVNKIQVKEEVIKEKPKQSETSLSEVNDVNFEAFLFVTNTNLKNNAGFYSMEYTFSFIVQLGKEKVFLEYQLFDKDDIILSEGKIADGDLRSRFSEQISVKSYFNYEYIKYKIVCKDKNANVFKTFEGECENPFYPKQLSFEVQSLHSDFMDNKRAVSQVFSYYMETTDDVVLEKVRVIPPAKDFYWDVLPDSPQKNIYKAISNIKDSTHSDYLECGEYHVQFLLGKSGIIQDTYLLKDLYDNENGPNYGAATATILSDDLNVVEWELQDLAYLKTMEFLLYEKNNKEEPLVNYTFKQPEEKIVKKELFQQLQKEKNSRKKIKFNKKYLYRIKLEYQNISETEEKVKFISFSPFYEITFYGFNLF